MTKVKRGIVRPLLALNLMPARIDRDPSDAPLFTYRGLASSVTAGMLLTGRSVVAGPYLTATNFYSDEFNNSGWFVSGGLLLALRPDRNRPREPDPPPQPSPYPYPYPMPSGPPGAPTPQPTTVPM